MLSYALQAALFTVLFMTIMENLGRFRISKINVFFGFFSISIPTYLVMMLFDNQALTNICVTIFTITYYSMRTKKILFCILITILNMVNIFLSEQIVVLIVLFIVGTLPDINNLMNLIIHNMLLATASFLLSYFIGKGMRKLKISKDGFTNNSYSNLIVFGFFSVFALFYCQIFIYPNIANRNLIALLSIIQGIVQITIISVAVFVFFNSEKKAREAEHNRELLNNLELYTNDLENMYNNMREFRHDYMNIISGIYGFIEMNDYKGLSEYLTGDILPIVAKMEKYNYSFDRVKKLHIPQLKGLIAMKLLTGAEKGIAVSIEIPDVIDAVGIELVDLTRITGILLDNAIEAGCESHEPRINLLVYKGIGVVYIIIANSFNKIEVPLEKIFEKDYSTKGEGRGLGLHNVRQITNKYGNIVLNTNIRGGEFIQQLCIEDIKAGEK